MEWDFTPVQVLKGEVDYKLDDFLRDLKCQLVYNFPKFSDSQIHRLVKLNYGVMLYRINGYNFKKVAKVFGIDKEFTEIIVRENEGLFKMLEATIMACFIRNLNESSGLIPDDENLRLINFELKQFYQSNDL